MAYVVIVFSFVILKIRILLIDSIICKMDHQIILILSCWSLVFFGRQSSQSFSIHEYFQRIYGLEQNIYSKIKFEIFYQIRVLNIFLHDIVFIRYKIIDHSCQKNSSTLTRSFRFTNIINLLCLICFIKSPKFIIL